MKEFMAILVLMSGLTNSESLKFRWSSEQGFDTSCGYSALVAVMATWWNISITEKELITETLNTDKIDNDFEVSFKTMSEILLQHGFYTKAYRMDWEQLKVATDKFAPIIIHLDKGMGHFAVLLGITEDTAILADPAQGTLFMNKNEFCNSWSGNVLLAISKDHNLQKNKLVKATKNTILRKETLERTVVTIKRLPR